VKGTGDREGGGWVVRLHISDKTHK